MMSTVVDDVLFGQPQAAPSVRPTEAIFGVGEATLIRPVVGTVMTLQIITHAISEDDAVRENQTAYEQVQRLAARAKVTTAFYASSYAGDFEVHRAIEIRASDAMSGFAVYHAIEASHLAVGAAMYYMIDDGVGAYNTVYARAYELAVQDAQADAGKRNLDLGALDGVAVTDPGDPGPRYAFKSPDLVKADAAAQPAATAVYRLNIRLRYKPSASPHDHRE